MTDQPPSNIQAARLVRRTPEIEVAIGARLKMLRLAAHMSQIALGEAIGVSFQQIQKYEKGKDRIAASTLQVLAAALGVHPGSFFEGEMPIPIGDLSEVRAALKSAAGAQRVNNPGIRKRLAALIDTLAEQAET